MAETTERTPAGELTARMRAFLVPLARALRAKDGSFAATELSVIGAISRNEPITVGDLATLEHLSVARVSRIVSALCDRGIVVREHDKDDRRLCRVRMSSLGKRWLRRGRAERDAWLIERLEKLEPDEIRGLMEAMPVLGKLAPGAME